MPTVALLRLIALREQSRRGLPPTKTKLIGALLLLLTERHPNIEPDESPEEAWSLVWQRLLYAGFLRAREFVQLQQAFLFSLRPDDPSQEKFHLDHVLSIIDAHLSEEDKDAPRWSSFFAELFDEAMTSAEPTRCVLVIEALLEEPYLNALQSLSESPKRRGALMRLSGMSETFSALFTRRPNLAASSAARLSISEGRGEAQQEQHAIILMQWFAGEISMQEAQVAFTKTAEQILLWGWMSAIREDAASHDERPVRMALIAMGSLGAQEMLYLSDLDLVFLYDGEEQERCINVAQRLLSLLSSNDGPRLYEIDTRLRPFGTQGPLVSSLESWARYYGLVEGEETRAQLWEEQALLRARPLCGERSLIKEFEDLHQRVLSKERSAAVVSSELRRMKQKIEQEIPKRGVFHYKASSGGLLDIDFVVQSRQLTHGDKNLASGSRGLSTHDLITSLAEDGALSIGDAKMLQAARHKLLRMILITRIVTEKTLDSLPESPDALRSVLRTEKLSLEEFLQSHLEPLRLQVRACFDRIVLKS